MGGVPLVTLWVIGLGLADGLRGPHRAPLPLRRAAVPPATARHHEVRRPCTAMAADTRAAAKRIQELPVLPERVWRARAAEHRERVRALLEPGFLRPGGPAPGGTPGGADGFWALDPTNPTFNFLLRYYNIRGATGTRRLARWSPGADVLLEGVVEERDATGDSAVLHRKALTPADCGGVQRYMYSSSEWASGSNISSFEWYQEVLAVTQDNPPILNCFGLHEWAMQYQPPGAPEPPSRKYQELPLRVSQAEINAAVERRGVRCTHVDALRFFAEAAKPLNRYGDLGRKDQVRLEQPACVHASMDLLKIALKLAPFGPAETLADALEVSIAARRLDVAASPYDASRFGLQPIKIENPEGRIAYREAQIALMNASAPVRSALLDQFSSILLAQ